MRPRFGIRSIVGLTVAGLIAIALSSSSSMAFAEAKFRYPEGRHGRGELRYVKNVPVLVVRGSHAEMGEQIGVLALKPAARAMELVNGFANRQIPVKLRPIADFAMQTLYGNFPAEYREELEAMSKASGVDRRSLVMANTIIDLQELVGCSSLLVSFNRSTTGGPLYGRNMDLPYVEGLAEFSLLIVYQPEVGHAFAMPNLPGFLMLASGMNDRGLALGSQSVGVPRDGSPRFSPEGIASAVAGRRLMEQCDDVAAAGKWLEENRLVRGVSIAACDPKQQTVFEVTTQRRLARKDNDGFCCATNHFRTPELAQETECWRYSRLDSARSVERISVKEVEDRMKSVNQGKMTVHTMIFEPSALRMHLVMGPGPATDRPMTAIDLADWLKQDPAPKP